MSDGVRPQAAELSKIIETVNAPDFPIPGLSEVLYTASENNMLGDLESIDARTALQVWKLVELSRTISPEQVAAIRM